MAARDEEAKPEDTLSEILLSLRVNALQIPPEHRRDFVDQLVKIDIFNITATKSLEFVMFMLNQNSHNLKHSLSAVLSILASTPNGIEYLVKVNSETDLSIPKAIIDSLRE